MPGKKFTATTLERGLLDDLLPLLLDKVNDPDWRDWENLSAKGDCLSSLSPIVPFPDEMFTKPRDEPWDPTGKYAESWNKVWNKADNYFPLKKVATLCLDQLVRTGSPIEFEGEGTLPPLAFGIRQGEPYWRTLNDDEMSDMDDADDQLAGLALIFLCGDADKRRLVRHCHYCGRFFMVTRDHRRKRSFCSDGNSRTCCDDFHNGKPRSEIAEKRLAYLKKIKKITKRR